MFLKIRVNRRSTVLATLFNYPYKVPFQINDRLDFSWFHQRSLSSSLLLLFDQELNKYLNSKKIQLANSQKSLLCLTIECCSVVDGNYFLVISLLYVQLLMEDQNLMTMMSSLKCCCLYDFVVVVGG